MIDDGIVVAAHKFCTRQRTRYTPETTVGCFYCEGRYMAVEIEDWCDELDGAQTTALCPKCGIDDVVSLQDVGALGVGPLEFTQPLKRMKAHWFNA